MQTMKRLFQLVAVIASLWLTPLPGIAQVLCAAASGPVSMSCCRHHAETDCGQMQATRSAMCSRPCCAGSQPADPAPQPAVIPPAAVLHRTVASPWDRPSYSVSPVRTPPSPDVQQRTARYVLYQDLRI